MIPNLFLLFAGKDGRSPQRLAFKLLIKVVFIDVQTFLLPLGYLCIYCKCLGYFEFLKHLKSFDFYSDVLIILFPHKTHYDRIH